MVREFHDDNDYRGERGYDAKAALDRNAIVRYRDGWDRIRWGSELAEDITDHIGDCGVCDD